MGKKMKLLVIFSISIIIFGSSCSSSVTPANSKDASSKKSIDEQNAEYAKKSQAWLEKMQNAKMQDKKENNIAISATRPELKADSEQIKVIQQKAMDGDADYQYSLAMCYKYGYGMPQDTEKSLYWFKKAADQGHRQASQVYNFMINRK